jgi:hypothetical protein
VTVPLACSVKFEKSSRIDDETPVGTLSPPPLSWVRSSGGARPWPVPGSRPRFAWIVSVPCRTRSSTP